MTPISAAQVLLPGQHAAPPGPVDMISMYVMHHAFRRDVTRFRAVVGSVDLADHARWRALHERWELFATVLHHHHVAEDTGLWPLLLERAQARADDGARNVLGAMAAEHALIDPSLEACTKGFASMAASPDAGVRSGLVESIGEVWQLLDDHLGHEERDAMALVQRDLRPADWHRVEREHFRPAYSLRQLLAVVPWAMTGLPQTVQRQVLSDAGPPMGLIWRATRGSFDRAETRVFGARPVGMVVNKPEVTTREPQLNTITALDSMPTKKEKVT